MGWELHRMVYSTTSRGKLIYTGSESHNLKSGYVRFDSFSSRLENELN